jgi:hypothetical protein
LYGDDNRGNTTIGGLLTVGPGATLVVHVSRLPRADERLVVIRFAAMSGTFEATHVGLENGTQLPECLNYYIYYLTNDIELLFFDSCKAANNIITFAFVLASLLAGVLVVVVVVAIVKRRCPRSLDWCLDCRRRWFEFSSMPSSVYESEMQGKGHLEVDDTVGGPEVIDITDDTDRPASVRHIRSIGCGGGGAEAPAPLFEVEGEADKAVTDMPIVSDGDAVQGEDGDAFEDGDGMVSVTGPAGSTIAIPVEAMKANQLRHRAHVAH